jgi:hypothetical protein
MYQCSESESGSVGSVYCSREGSHELRYGSVDECRSLWDTEVQGNVEVLGWDIQGFRGIQSSWDTKIHGLQKFMGYGTEV